MTRTRAIDCEMDGVRIDSEELHARAKRIAFAHAGIAFADAALRSYTTGGEYIRVGWNSFSWETASTIGKTCPSHLSVPQRRAAYLSPAALRYNTEDERTLNILSRGFEGKPDRPGVVISVEDGIPNLQELHTSHSKLILQTGIEGSK
jgi:hypothetical protein